MAPHSTAKLAMPKAGEALPGRREPILTAERHAVTGARLTPPYPADHRIADFGLGCFWGAERKFWVLPGVFVTAVGYQGGSTPNATYEEICSGRTGHAEVVRVVYDPRRLSYGHLLKVFFESHDPTQGMRQGNDIGTQYRSAIYTHDDDQRRQAIAARDLYAGILAKAGYGPITTEIAPADSFYFAEAYHQQYLAKNPNGYCGLGGTGEICPISLDLDPRE